MAMQLLCCQPFCGDFEFEHLRSVKHTTFHSKSSDLCQHDVEYSALVSKT